MKPLKAHKYEESRVTYSCYGQPKLNGLRALYQNGFFYSQDFERWNDPVVSHLVSELRDVFDSRIVLDGEIYYHGWLLQQINSACGVTRIQPNERTHLVEYHIFDVVNFSRSFVDRTYDTFQRLSHARLPHCKVVAPTILYDRASADRFYASQVSLGYEGMMYRLGECPYTKPNQPGSSPSNHRARFLSDQNNRVWHMLKRKDWQDDEYLIVSMEEGEGKLVGMVGALVCQIGTGLQFKVASFEGYSHHELAYMFKNQDEYIGAKATIKYLTLTEENIPFNARVIAIRN